jgi:hypothetical protein
MARGGAGAAGLEGRCGAAASEAAFFTERMAVPAGAPAAAGAALSPLPRLIRARMRSASSSLIELLWLRAAILSFSAASRTSLFSRPRSRDSS